MATVIGVSAGADGVVWCADSAGNLYMRVGSEWKRNPTAKATEVAVGSASHVWCRNADGRVFKLQGANFDGGWSEDPDASLVKQSIAAGSDGTVWVVNTKGELVKREKGQWKHNPTGKNAVEVSVGDTNNVWCLNNLGQPFRLSGTTADSPWLPQTVPGLPVASIGAGNDGAVWVANTKGELFAKDGPTWRMNDKGKAVQISVGNRNLVWCVNAAGELFHAQANDWNTFWVKVAPPAGLPGSRHYTVREGDKSLLAILRKEYPGTVEADVVRRADRVARLNKWPGTLQDNYGGFAQRMQPGDVLILEA